MKSLSEFMNEALLNEERFPQFIDDWVVWGKLDRQDLNSFKRSLAGGIKSGKFEVVEDKSDYEDDTFKPNTSNTPGYYIDLTIKGKFRDIEKFADKFYLPFATVKASDSYQRFIADYPHKTK